MPCSLIAGVSMWSWPAACLVAAATLMLGGLRLLAELRWRRVALGLAEASPAGTIVDVTESSWLPGVRVRVGPRPRRACGGGDAAPDL
jgi:hypothetical protein